ncbi:hypothetical protein HDE_03619 [Halotydeus destructor]|nr:hypothetical protein HDE_03619 [Halotydeus destructor]
MFRVVGGNEQLQSLNKKINIFFALTKLDIQLSTSTLILWLQTGFIDYDFDRTELKYVGLAAIETVVWLTLGYQAIKRKSHMLLFFFYGTSIIEPCLIIYNVYKTIKVAGFIAQSLEIAICICSTLSLTTRFLANIYLYRVSKSFLSEDVAEAVGQNLSPADEIKSEGC